MSAEKEKLETFCMCCGDPLARKDLGATMQDPRVPEWQEGTFMQITAFHICKKCWLERKQWLAAGIRGAVTRQEERLKEDAKKAGLIK